MEKLNERCSQTIEMQKLISICIEESIVQKAQYLLQDSFNISLFIIL